MLMYACKLKLVEVVEFLLDLPGIVVDVQDQVFRYYFRPTVIIVSV